MGWAVKVPRRLDEGVVVRETSCRGSRPSVLTTAREHRRDWQDAGPTIRSPLSTAGLLLSTQYDRGRKPVRTFATAPSPLGGDFW